MFDPYHKWLGIPREEQPPNLYRLLGISLFERDPEVIDAAANRLMAYLQGCATGTQALLSQRLLNEVAAARLCLLNPEKKATYDNQLRAKRSGGKRVSTFPEPDSEPVPTSGNYINTPDENIHPFEGIEQEVDPYESISIPSITRGSRSHAYTRRKSRLRVVALTLVFLGGVVIAGAIYLNKQSSQVQTVNDDPQGGEEQHKERMESRSPTVDDTKSNLPNHLTKVSPPNIQDGPPGEFTQFRGHTWGVLCVAFSPDGKYAISGSRDRTIRVWDSMTGEEIRKFEGHELGVWGIAITNDQHRLVSCGPDSTVRLWDFDTGTELRVFRGHTSWVGSVLITNGGSSLISSSAHSDDLTTRRWDAKSGIELQRIGLSGPLALSPDGESILIGGFQSLTLWDKSLSLKRGGFGAQQGYVSSVAFSPDGKYVVSAGGEKSDSSIRLWDASTHQEIRRFVGHQNLIKSVAFSPNGRTIISGGADELGPKTDASLRMWDVESGNQIHQFIGHTQPITSVAFSPDGRFALSGSEDSTARVWRLPESTYSSSRTSGRQVVGSTIQSSASPEKNTPVASTPTLQGDWLMVMEEVNGERDTVTEKRKVSITGNDFVMSRTRNGKNGVYVGKIDVDAPHQSFDFIGKGPHGAHQEFKGIYELEGSLLRLCYVYSAGNYATRPTKLSSYFVPDTTMVSLVLQRMTEK